MAVKLDNMDSVLKQLAKMERAVATEVIREARDKMRALMRSQLPPTKQSTPTGKSGALAKSPKVRSRSRRGVSTAQVIWDIKQKQEQTKTVFKIAGVGIKKSEESAKEQKKRKKFFNYAGVVNFTKKNQKSPSFGSKLWDRNKPILDQEGLKIVKESFEEVFKRHGVKFK